MYNITYSGFRKSLHITVEHNIKKELVFPFE